MKLAIMISLVAMMAVATGCGSDGGPGLGLPLGPAPWKDGDRVAYDQLDRGGNKVGSAVFGFKKEGDVWVLSGVDKTARIQQDISLRIHTRTFRPLGEEKTVTAMGTTAKISSSYKEGKLEISGVVNGEKKVASVDVPATAVDNDQLLMTLRAMKFSDGFQVPQVHVVGLSGLDVDVAIAVKGKETVQVPAGSFEAWVVELDFGQTRHQAWYQVEPAQDMVQYDNGVVRLVLAK